MSTRKLTIGMLTRDDFDGAYFSIQSIRLHHPEVLDEIEFLILDNHPTSPHGQAVSRFSGWVQEPIRVLPMTDPGGTSLRSHLFELAETPYVLCMDSHVLLAPGALRKLIDGMDAGQDQGHLLQGPLVGDNMKIMATHMAHVWRGGMLGIWSVAWRCPCGEVYQTRQREDKDGNWLDIQTMTMSHQTLTNCSRCDFAFPAGMRWECHENALEASGMRPAWYSDEPFEIPAQGLGLFACRKEVWPGFNPRFRDFGGEECYIHEKFRQMGKTTVCLPFLKWLHRFERPAGLPYQAPWESRIMNYLIGHMELGLDPHPVLHYFSAFLNKKIVVRWKGATPVRLELLTNP